MKWQFIGNPPKKHGKIMKTSRRNMESRGSPISKPAAYLPFSDERLRFLHLKWFKGCEANQFFPIISFCVFIYTYICMYMYIYIYCKSRFGLDQKKKTKKHPHGCPKKNLQSMPQNFPPKTLHGLDSDPLVVGSQEPRRSRV